MQQVIFIHGGKCFSSREGFRRALENRNCDFFCEEKKKWQYWLKEKLGNNYQYATPEMPLNHFASYEEWKLWFEKIFPQLNDEGTILIGHSLGTLFLLKYLAENCFPKKITQLHLVGTLIDGKNLPPDANYIGDFAFDITLIPSIQHQVDQIFIYHSKDDFACSYADAERLSVYLPRAELLTFDNRGHFGQAEFPELLENILAK